MPFRRLALALGMLSVATTGAAQQNPTLPDSDRAGIHRTLRAFYFNLAHGDWEALSADILPAKVVAHRAAPEGLVTAAASIEDTTVMLDGDWAEVSVRRCTEPRGADEFRLIRFGGRWRFVHIDLFQDPLHLVSDQ